MNFIVYESLLTHNKMAKPCPNQGTLSLGQTWNASSSNKLLLLETERALAKKANQNPLLN